MRKSNIISGLLATGLAFGCNNEPNLSDKMVSNKENTSTSKPQSNSRNIYSVSIESLLESPEQYEDKQVSVEGTPYACSRTVIDDQSFRHFSLAVYIGSQDRSMGLLGYSWASIDYHTKAEALINGVINSCSNQKIVLKGRFKNSVIELESIHAKGCDLRFN